MARRHAQVVCADGTCRSNRVVLSRPIDRRTGRGRWRYRCLTCAVAWWQDEDAEIRDLYRDGVF